MLTKRFWKQAFLRLDRMSTRDFYKSFILVTANREDKKIRKKKRYEMEIRARKLKNLKNDK